MTTYTISNDLDKKIIGTNVLDEYNFVIINDQLTFNENNTKDIPTLEQLTEDANTAWEAKEQAEQDQIDLKASAKAKLIAGEPLTEEEADTIVL
tara:strand:+ start:114 stop:395 length:282 start_codon:yes stop_codon:yes gene_type:complete